MTTTKSNDNAATTDISKTVYRPIMDETYTLQEDTLQTRPLSSNKVIDQTLPTITDNSSLANNTPSSTLSNPTDEGVLVKTAKSETLTDSNLLQDSEQLIEPNRLLADEHALAGTNIEHMDVTTKQWVLSLNWHRTSVAKPGLISKFKGLKQTLDLDLSCLLCNRYGEIIEQVWFKNMRDQAESIRHLGDEILGAKPMLPENIETELVASDAPTTDYPDTKDPGMNQESISIYLSKIPPHIFHVVMVLSSYTGHALNQVDAGHCELGDDEGNVILHIDLTTIPTASALWIATLTRVGESWRFNADLQPLNSYKMDDIAQQVSEHILRTAK